MAQGFKDQRLLLPEITTPTTVASHGSVYTKTDNALYFQDGAGTEHTVVRDAFYAEMTMYESADDVTINTASVYHMMMGFSTGILSGWTFGAGRVVDANIANEIDDTQLKIETSAAHNLTTGDTVGLSNMNNAGHNGITDVTVVDATNFTCDDIAYVAGAGASAGVVDEPSYLQASTGSAGIYLCHISITGDSAANNKFFKLEININSTEPDTIVVEKQFSNNDLDNLSCSGLLTIADGDRVYVAIQDKTDATDFQLQHGNVTLHKIA